ncbi:rab small monomeric GTPase [Pelomyxa schiedti]|nr:rab small monomeric GTPase [Pelomyxa schiedti]
MSSPPAVRRKKFLMKAVILGDCGVGKTSLLSRYVKSTFSSVYKATIGVDFLTKELQVGEMTVTLQIWDTSGQERFSSLGPAFFRGADCCVLVYDVTSAKTLASITSWQQGFLEHANPKYPETFPFIVLGNKIDLANERVVTQREAMLWCQSHGKIPYFETSAKEIINIEQAFFALVTAALSQPDDSDDFPNITPEPLRIPRADFSGETSTPKKSCC